MDVSANQYNPQPNGTNVNLISPVHQRYLLLFQHCVAPKLYSLVCRATCKWLSTLKHVLQENVDFHDMKLKIRSFITFSFSWRHNERDDVSNHRRLGCLLKRMFSHTSKKTPKLRVTGLYEGNSPVNSWHKGQVTRKIFPFDDIIMAVSFVELVKNHGR